MNATYAPTATPINATLNSTNSDESAALGEGALWAAVSLAGCFLLCYCCSKIQHYRERRKDKALQKWLSSRHA